MLAGLSPLAPLASQPGVTAGRQVTACCMAHTTLRSALYPHLQVQDRDLSHIGRVNANCTSLGNTSGLLLNTSSTLVSPIVVVAYNRPRYLARAMVSLLR